MNRLLIAALFIAMVSCGIQRSPARLSDTKTVLAEMDKDAFGSTIISCVALNAAAGNPQEEITLLIEEMISGLESTQSEADEENRTNQAACDTNIEAFTNEIVQTKATIKSTEESIAVNSEILSNAQTDLAQADADYEEVVENIETGTRTREAEHNRWIEEDYQNQVSIATLEEGVKLINHMIHGVAFSQIKSRYDKVLEKLRDDQNKHSSLFKPLISSLTQLATKLNYDNVMKILELLNNIRLTIVAERESSRLSEETSQQDWERLLAHLTSEKQRLTDKRARLRTLIENTTVLLAQLRESLESNKVQLENAELNLANTQQKCTEQSVAYAQLSYEVSRELEILNRLLDHIREKYAQVSEYVASRA